MPEAATAGGDGLRLVSLVPSMTETLVAWGVPPIACTRFCEQPTIAHVGGTKDPDLEAIIGLAPDLVLMDREENRRDDAEALRAAGFLVHATHITSVDDVEPELRRVRALVGLDDELAPTQRRNDASSDAATGGPARAFVAIWRRPWMTCSGETYGSSLLASIGIDNVYASAETPYPTVTLDEVAERMPDMVLLPSEPYPFAERHVAEIAVAIPSARICFVDGQDLFWWGARTPAARVRLAGTLVGQAGSGR